LKTQQNFKHTGLFNCCANLGYSTTVFSYAVEL